MNRPVTQVLLYIAVAIVTGFVVNGLRQNPLPLLAQPLEQATDIPVSPPESGSEESDPTTGMESTEPTLRSVSLDQAKKLHDQGIIFIDAREKEYFVDGHIAGAMPSDNFMEMTFQLDLRQGRDAPVVTYCDGDDCGSSEDLAYDLQAAGFTKIYVFSGGWSEWTSAGYPVESGMIEADDVD